MDGFRADIRECGYAAQAMPGVSTLARADAELNPPVMPQKAAPKGRSGALLLVVFCVIWGVGSAAAIGVSLVQIARAARAQSWPIAAGTVTQSKVDGCCEDATARVEYTFVAAGRTWRGDTIHPITTSGETKARARVAQYSVGSTVSVRYLPSDPGVSMLEPGVQRADIAVLMLMTPFGLLSGAIVVGLLGYRRERTRPHTARFGMMSIDRVDGSLVFSLRERWVAAVVGLAGGAFAGLPLVFLLWIAEDVVPLAGFVAAWIAQLGLVGALWVWKARQYRRGDWIMVVDAVRRELLPARALNRGREHASSAIVPFDAVRSIELREHRGEDKSQFRPVAKLADGNAVVLADWMERQEAEVLAAWFVGVVGINQAAQIHADDPRSSE